MPEKWKKNVRTFFGCWNWGKMWQCTYQMKRTWDFPKFSFYFPNAYFCYCKWCSCWWNLHFKRRLVLCVFPFYIKKWILYPQSSWFFFVMRDWNSFWFFCVQHWYVNLIRFFSPKRIMSTVFISLLVIIIFHLDFLYEKNILWMTFMNIKRFFFLWIK